MVDFDKEIVGKIREDKPEELSDEELNEVISSPIFAYDSLGCHKCRSTKTKRSKYVDDKWHHLCEKCGYEGPLTLR